MIYTEGAIQGETWATTLPSRSCAAAGSLSLWWHTPGPDTSSCTARAAVTVRYNMGSSSPTWPQSDTTWGHPNMATVRYNMGSSSPTWPQSDTTWGHPVQHGHSQIQHGVIQSNTASQIQHGVIQSNMATVRYNMGSSSPTWPQSDITWGHPVQHGHSQTQHGVILSNMATVRYMGSSSPTWPVRYNMGSSSPTWPQSDITWGHPVQHGHSQTQHGVILSNMATVRYMGSSSPTWPVRYMGSSSPT